MIIGKGHYVSDLGSVYPCVPAWSTTLIRPRSPRPLADETHSFEKKENNMKKHLYLAILHFTIVVFAILSLTGCENQNLLPDPFGATQTPAAADFDVTNLTQKEGSVTEVTITPKAGKSPGVITIYYNGSTTIPQTAGAYSVTFNVAAATGWNAVNGLYAERLTVSKDSPDNELLPDTPITNAQIVVKAPVKGVTPDTAADGAGYFTIGPVSWSPAHSLFQGDTVYTASVTLTAISRYTFKELNSATINGQNATISSNTGKAVILSYTFPPTGPDTVTVTGITIKNQPIYLSYTHGDTLDLTGLVVTLTYDDATTENVPVGHFADKNITANPSQGNSLVRSTHDGRPVVITYGDLTTLGTDKMIVNPKDINFTVDPIPDQTYTGSQIRPAVVVKDGTKKLTQTTDYTVSYANNTNPGTAAVTITGAGNYAGSYGNTTFTINPGIITNVDLFVIAPVTGAAPSKASGAVNFTIDEVSWSPAHNPFQGKEVYTVTLILTANSGYNFTGISSATVNRENAKILSNNGSVVMLSYEFPETKPEAPPYSVFNGTRYLAVLNPAIGNARIKYYYTYDGLDCYYIYLGQYKNVPLYYEGRTHRYSWGNSTSRTYEFSTTNTTIETFSTTVSQTRQQTVGVAEEHTESGSKEKGWHIGGRIGADDERFQISGGYGETTSKFSSDTLGKYTEITTSLTNTVEYGKSWLNEHREVASFTFTRGDREGYFRHTCFADFDMYLLVIKERGSNTLYYEFREHIIPDSPFWDLDYSATNDFNKDDDSVFVIDVSELGDLPTPSIDFDIYAVSNTAEWDNAISKIQSKGNGTAGNPKTYTIVVRGNVTITPSTFGSVQHVEVTLTSNLDSGQLLRSGKLSLGANGNMIRIGKNQKLIIDDANLILQGRSDNWTSLLFVDLGGNLELKNGTITGNISNDSLGSTNGGGVFVYGESGIFTMYGGNISHNSGSLGGGVYACGGNFIMHGGTISDNLKGGGVNVGGGKFTMYGGTIERNKLTNSYNGGGGVSVVEGGKFTMEGGEIKLNEARVVNNNNAWAGGVLIHGAASTFSKSGGFIYGKKSPDSENKVNVVSGTKYALAVYYSGNGTLARNETLGENDKLSTSSTDGWGK